MSRSGRVGVIGVVAGWLALALGVTSGGGVTSGVLALLCAIGGLMAVAAWRCAFAPYVALTTDRVVVQNPLLPTSIPYADIASLQPGYYGVRIRRRRGVTVTAWAVQKSNLSRWIGSSDTRTDELAAAIEARANLQSRGPLGSAGMRVRDAYRGEPTIAVFGGLPHTHAGRCFARASDP